MGGSVKNSWAFIPESQKMKKGRKEGGSGWRGVEAIRPVNGAGDTKTKIKPLGSETRQARGKRGRRIEKASIHS